MDKDYKDSTNNRPNSETTENTKSSIDIPCFKDLVHLSNNSLENWLNNVAYRLKYCYYQSDVSQFIKLLNFIIPEVRSNFK